MKKASLVTCLCILMSFCILLGGCSNEKDEIESVEQLNSKDYTVGVFVGSMGMYAAEKSLPEADYVAFSSDVDGYLAVQSGRVDALVYDRIQMEFAIGAGLDGVHLLDGSIGESFDVSVGISPKSEIPDLKNKVNSFLSEMKFDGTLDNMYYRWVTTANSQMPDIPKAENPEYTLTVGTSGVVPPFSYFEGSTVTGYDIEMIYRFAYWLNADVSIEIYDYTGLITAAESGLIDCIMANLNATEERRQKIDFSDAMFQSVISVMVGGESKGENYTSLSDFKDKKFGVLNGSVFDQIIIKSIPGATNIMHYPTYSDQLAALQSGHIDAAVFDEPVARIALAKNKGLKIFPEVLATDKYGIAFAKNSTLDDEFTTIIEKYSSDGTLISLKEKWTGADDSIKTVPSQDWPGTRGTLNYYYDVVAEPMSYVGANGEVLGLEVELILKIAKELDFRINFVKSNTSSLIAAIEGGKADLAGCCMSITEERAKIIDFTAPYYYGSTVLVIRDGAPVTEKTGFFESLAKSFNSTFIVEGRWKLILDGLAVTVIISILSGIFGLLFGFGLCMLRKSKNKPSKITSSAFIRLIQGTPILVLLMLLYYVVFKSTNISGVIIAVVGFSLNFGAYTSEIMRSGIDTVDRGQRDAALAMGYSKIQAFWRIVFPQAARNFLPVLKGEFISMVKMTSVVGYIAVQDLTKVSDIIRSRTMEAFFPLLVTAAIYFLVANLLTAVLSYIEHRVEPKRGKAKLRGVQIEE